MKIDFLGIPVDSLTMGETILLVDNAIRHDKHINHVVINAGKVVSMQKDKELFESVTSCDVINADGQSIVWAARFLGKHLPERVAGADLMQELVQLAYENEYKCFFFGAKEEVVKKVVDTYSEKYGSSIIAGYRNGYFSKNDEPQVARQIAESGAQLLFVAITSPRKENFMFEYRNILSNVNFTMGVGGTFDVISGFTKRAPVWMQDIGMEWFYRMAQEPRRMWRRYLFGNTKFIWYVIKEKIALTNFPALPAWLYNTFNRVVIGSSELNKANVREDGIAFSDSTAQQPVSQPIPVQAKSTKVIRIREALEYWGKIPRITAFLFGRSPIEEVQIPEELLPDHLRNALGLVMSPIIPKGISLSLTNKVKEVIPAVDQLESNAG